MPFRSAEVVGFPVEQDAVGGVIEMIIAATDALIFWLQQVFMLMTIPRRKYPSIVMINLGSAIRSVRYYLIKMLLTPIDESHDGWHE